MLARAAGATTALGVACDFEGTPPFEQVGVNLNILQPGQPMTMYHRKGHQEGFLVIAGEWRQDVRRIRRARCLQSSSSTSSRNTW
jgi:uncharacterized cupin superfamily protein